MNQEFKPAFAGELKNKWQVKCIPCKFELSNLTETEALEKADKHKGIAVADFCNHLITIKNLWRF